jgi:hypothetical protein
MEDVLKKMPNGTYDVLENRVHFMAATWSTERDSESWKQSVTMQITSVSFARHLTHAVLLILYDAARLDTASRGIAEVLKFVPSKLATAAAERQAAADNRGRLTCYRCRNHVTEWLLNNDPVGCVIRIQTGVQQYYNSATGNQNNEGCTELHSDFHMRS